MSQAQPNNTSYNSVRTMGRSAGELGGDQFGWAQVQANNDAELRQIRSQLQANDMSLPDEIWEDYNETVMEEALVSLNAVSDLEDAGLTMDVDFATTVVTWPIMGEMTPAEQTMDARTRSEMGSLSFGEAGAPVPITHKDYDIPRRKLEQAQRGGQGLSTAHARMASRVVSESLEDMLFNGTQIGGVQHNNQTLKLHGYRTAPNRNTYSNATSDWTDPKEVFDDLNQMVGVLEDDNFTADSRGYWLYLSPVQWKQLRSDYNAEGDTVVRDKVEDIPEISQVSRSTFLPDGEAVMIKPVPEVIELARDPREIQNIQWESHGGMNLKYKVMAMYAPMLKSTYAGRSGLLHATGLGTTVS